MPSNRKGKIKIKDFLHLPILSEETFKAIDRFFFILFTKIYISENIDLRLGHTQFFYYLRNGDGFITLGEVKLANKDFSIRDISKVTVV